MVSNCLSVGMPTSDKHRVRKQTSHAAKALQAQRFQRESLGDSGAEALRPALQACQAEATLQSGLPIAALPTTPGCSQETEEPAVSSPYDPAALQAEAAPHAATFEDVQLQLAALELHRWDHALSTQAHNARWLQAIEAILGAGANQRPSSCSKYSTWSCLALRSQTL